MPDVAPPKSPPPAPENVAHPEPRRFSLRRVHDRLWDRVWHFLGGEARRRVIRWALWPVRALVSLLDLPVRWLASLSDLLVHWWLGFLKTLRSDKGYVVLGSAVAVYFAVFGLIDNKSTQEETRASLERSIFMSMVTSGDAPSFDAAMQTFGPVQTTTATEHPDLFRFWTWGRTSQPNMQPMHDWAVARLGNCPPIGCSLPPQMRLNLVGARLSGADLHDVGLNRADLRTANLFSAHLSHTDLSGAELYSSDLSHADLSRAILVGASLTFARLSGADLHDAALSDADLSYADLSRAILVDANLTRARLSRADLSGADLSGARLYGADLSHGVDLRHTNLTGADLRGAQYDEDTKFSPGFDPQAAGMLRVEY